MDPAIIGRPLLAFVVGALILAGVCMFITQAGSPERYVTVFTIVINLFFLAGVLLWIRKAGMRNKKEAE